MKLSEYILTPRDERIAHINEFSDCILGNTNASRRTKKAMLEEFGLENDIPNWKIGKIEICHQCPCNSINGYCENPDHIYIGTSKENMGDKTDEARKAIHAEKNEQGQSIHAVRAAEATHAEKNEKGQSVNAVKAGEAAAEKLGKPVLLTEIETGKTYLFPSAHEAARGLNLHRSLISAVLNGKRRIHKGFTAVFIEDLEAPAHTFAASA